MQRLIEFVLQRRGLVLLGLAVLVALGLAAWQRLPVDAFPDVTSQQVMVLTEADGLGPLDIEQQVTLPIESVMGGLPHVRLVRSLSKPGLSQVVIVFEDQVDTYFARQLVFERLQLAREQLPPGVEPELGPISTGLGEVFQYTLESDRRDLTELRTIQDWMVAPRLRSLSGVNEVNSFGGRVRQIEVCVDPDRLLAYGLDLPQIIGALAANNANAGGGFIVKEWEQEHLRSVGLFGSPADIEAVVLRSAGGTPVYLRDVAEVREGYMTRQGAVSRDGQGEVVAGMVIMLKDSNSKEVVERVKAALPAIERSLPEDVRVRPFYDRTSLVRAVVGTISSALLQGALLVVLVLFVVMGNLRAAIVLALSLPITALCAFILMDAADVTANLMSLGGLAIAVGMIADGSIVVTENILRHLRERRGGLRDPRAGAGSERPAGGEGERADAGLYRRAVGEVARPIAFSILIVVLVFLPLFALQGMEGKMFKPLALTTIFAMLGSLLVALTVTPVILSYLLRQGALREPRFFEWLKGRYLALLGRALTHRRWTLGLALAIFLATCGAATLLGSEFLPVLDEGAIAINCVRLPNASLPGSIRTADFMEEELLAFPEVETVVSKTGRAEISEDPMGPEQTDLLIMLHPEKEWTTGRSKEELVAAIAERLGRVPGVRLAFSQPIALRVNELISGVKGDLAVKVFGHDLGTLKAAGDEMAGVLRGIRGAADVSVEQIAGYTQLEVIPDRGALARHQLNIEDLNELIETAVGGRVATEIVEGPMRFGVRVRFPEDRRDGEAALRRLLLPAPSGARVPLGQVAELRRSEGPAQISRENGMRRVVVETNVRGRDLGGFVGDAQERLAELTAALPPGYWVEYGGSFENQQRAMRRLAIVVPLSVLLIFVMLVSALGGLAPAGLVLGNLPFALVGGVLSMLLFGIRLNVPATIGFIALFGTAVQNGTVLVTFIQQLRREGMALREAVVTGCGLRFRALLMTAATTVLGLVPMLYAAGNGAEVQRPLAVVVVGGMLTATLLTLFVLPTLYDWWRPAAGRE